MARNKNSIIFEWVDDEGTGTHVTIVMDGAVPAPFETVEIIDPDGGPSYVGQVLSRRWRYVPKAGYREPEWECRVRMGQIPDRDDLDGPVPLADEAPTEPAPEEPTAEQPKAPRKRGPGGRFASGL